MNPRRAPADLPASARDRLRGLARERGVEFQLLRSEFSIERRLYRLGVSAHAEQFVLKGATLFKLQGRATWDLDLLGRGASGVDDVVAVIGDLCRIEAADGIVFDIGTLDWSACKPSPGPFLRRRAVAFAASRAGTAACGPAVPVRRRTPS